MCNHYRTDKAARSTWLKYIGWAVPTQLELPIDLIEDVWPKRRGAVATIGADGERIIEAMA